MCGIGAISRAEDGSAITNTPLSLRLMAIGLLERGEDATGFGWVTSRDPHPYYWRDQGPASRLAWNVNLPQGIQTGIVHTRFATQGPAKDNVNNHPVVAPGIVLVHNGIVSNDDELFRLLNCERHGQVDSEAVAALLAHGPDAFGTDSVPELLELVEGDAALAWLETRDPSVLHLARLASRPLVLAWTAKGDLLAASTYTAIQCAAMGATLVDVEHIPEGTYLQVRAGRIIRTAKVDLPAPKYGKVTTYGADGRVTTTYGGSGNAFEGWPDADADRCDICYGGDIFSTSDGWNTCKLCGYEWMNGTTYPALPRGTFVGSHAASVDTMTDPGV